MSAPLCLGCGVNPVRHVIGSVTREYRVIDGITWRDYCSRGCCLRTIATGRDQTHSTRQLVERNREGYRARTRARLLAGAQKCLEDGATPAAIAKFAWACERMGYHRGYAAAWIQRRRQVLA